MAKLLKLRRGSTSQHSSFTGAEGEVTVDTDKEALVVHDGSTAGGFPVARADGSGVSNFTITGELDAASLDISGNADIDGTLEADAYTVDGTALNEYIADTVGGMVTGNTETGIAVTYEDGDNTLDFVVSNATGLTGTPDITVNDVTAASLDISGNADIDGTLEADAYTVNGTALDTHIAGVTVTNATNASHVSVADNESTDENNKITFIENASATGNVGLESDGDFHYNPSGGLLSVPAVTTTGNITVGGDLTVSGTTTTVNSTTLTVDDKNIELGSVSSPSDTTADGGGITLKGASDKEIKWVNSTDAWTFNQDIEVTTGSVILRAAEGGDANFYLYADEGDDNADKWLIQSESDGYFALKNYTSGSWETNIKAIGDGTVELYHNDTKKIETTAAGVTVAGSVTDDKGDVRKIPQNYQANAYTLVASDAGKHILADANVTWTDNTFGAGDAVTIINASSGNITITKGTNMYNAADATNANRTLAAKGMATILWASGTAAYISGAGLS